MRGRREDPPPGKLEMIRAAGWLHHGEFDPAALERAAVFYKQYRDHVVAAVMGSPYQPRRGTCGRWSKHLRPTPRRWRSARPRTVKRSQGFSASQDRSSIADDGAAGDGRWCRGGRGSRDCVSTRGDYQPGGAAFGHARCVPGTGRARRRRSRGTSCRNVPASSEPRALLPRGL